MRLLNRLFPSCLLDDDNKVPWALPHVYDYMEGRDATRYSYPLLSASYNGRQYLTAYGKQQKSAFGTVYVDHDACRIVILVLFLFLIASQHWGMKVQQPIILRLLKQELMMWQ